MLTLELGAAAESSRSVRRTQAIAGEPSEMWPSGSRRIRPTGDAESVLAGVGESDLRETRNRS
jgi:hypothetical protein